MKAIYNVDWLEFYCQFDRWRDREWIFEHLDWYEMEAEKKPFTTRVYNEVWTITSKGEEVGTLCCVPLSTKDAGGILPSWACQFKFANWVCYNLYLRNIVENTFKALSIKPLHISRVDFCADFQYFECGLRPVHLITGYVRGKYTKVNQPNVRLFGKSKSQIEYNSVSWGSKSSDIFTRFYDKSLEQVEEVFKPWIVTQWASRGFDTERQPQYSYTKKSGCSVEYHFKVPIWRVEFAIHHNGRHYRKDDEVKEIEWGDITPEGIIDKFLSLAYKYFDFRKVEEGKSKYKCEQLKLFPHTDIMQWQRLPNHEASTNRTDVLVAKRLGQLAKEHPEGSWNNRVLEEAEIVVDTICHRSAKEIIKSIHNK